MENPVESADAPSDAVAGGDDVMVVFEMASSITDAAEVQRYIKDHPDKVQLKGIDTPSPTLLVKGRQFMGQVSETIGSDILFRVPRTADEHSSPQTNVESILHRRITFTEVQDVD
eukprot:m.91652 g.91652  ORF g.91652 m.91652 type:complete len:115 (+) comp16504_c0_seq4:329-673(+)